MGPEARGRGGTKKEKKKEEEKIPHMRESIGHRFGRCPKGRGKISTPKFVDWEMMSNLSAKCFKH